MLELYRLAQISRCHVAMVPVLTVLQLVKHLAATQGSLHAHYIPSVNHMEALAISLALYNKVMEDKPVC